MATVTEPRRQTRKSLQTKLLIDGQWRERFGRAGPVEPPIRPRQLRGVAGALRGLGLRPGVPGQCLQCQRGAQRRQGVVQRGGGAAGADRHGAAQQHRARVQPGIHLHDGDPALVVAGEHGGLDRRRAPPARQQAGMHVQAPAAWRVQHGLWQDQPVGRDHRHVQPERRERRLGGRVPLKRDGVAHRQAHRLRGDGHRAACQVPAASGRARRLGVDRGDRVPGGVQRAQGRDGEVRAAHEGKPHQPAALSFMSLASRRISMLRLSADRWSTNSTPSRWSSSCCRQAASRPSASTCFCTPSASW